MRIRLISNRSAARPHARFAARLSARGFALVEVLIAGCILGFSVVSLYSAYSFGFGLLRLSQENVRADQILLQKMETLRVYDWSKTKITTSGGIILPSFSEAFSPGAPNPGAVYNGSISIADAPVSESYSNSLRQVTVSLNWVSGGVTRNRSITTFVSQYGIQTL